MTQASSFEASAFGVSAARLAGQAGLLLGWRPSQFWSATPAELAAILTAALPSVGEGISRDTLNAMLEREANG